MRAFPMTPHYAICILLVGNARHGPHCPKPATAPRYFQHGTALDKTNGRIQLKFLMVETARQVSDEEPVYTFSPQPGYIVEDSHYAMCMMEEVGFLQGDKIRPLTDEERELITEAMQSQEQSTGVTASDSEADELQAVVDELIGCHRKGRGRRFNLCTTHQKELTGELFTMSKSAGIIRQQYWRRMPCVNLLGKN
jgi:hypothetical protein